MIPTALMLALIGSQEPASPGPIPELQFEKLLTASRYGLQPTPYLRSKDGKRVRVTGFMVGLEDAPLGGFYLTPSPVMCDESGAGIGDLPPNAVLVIVRSSKGRSIEHTKRKLAVTGRISVQSGRLEQGFPAPLVLTMDNEQDLAQGGGK